jgi:hypothetical protein
LWEVYDIAKTDRGANTLIGKEYNENVSADYEIDSILDFIKDQDLRDKIINSKITTYEEI